jgi:hypothetical protein
MAQLFVVHLHFLFEGKTLFVCIKVELKSVDAIKGVIMFLISETANVSK